MKKKAKKYIKGYKIGPLVGNGSSDTNEWTIKLPATAAVLDGISTVVIAPQPIGFPPTARSYFDLNINNERVASKLNLLYTSIFWTDGTAALPSTYVQNYHPIPRPLSGSDEVRIIFDDCYWIALGLTGPTKVYFHFHYQPKQ